MKLAACFFAFICLFTSSVKAASIKEIYSNAEEQIVSHYEKDGEWNVSKINRLNLVKTESEEFVLVSAKVFLKKIHSGKSAVETCLVAFIRDNNEFNSINCFSN